MQNSCVSMLQARTLWYVKIRPLHHWIFPVLLILDGLCLVCRFHRCSWKGRVVEEVRRQSQGVDARNVDMLATEMAAGNLPDGESS